MHPLTASVVGLFAAVGSGLVCLVGISLIVKRWGSAPGRGRFSAAAVLDDALANKDRTDRRGWRSLMEVLLLVPVAVSSARVRAMALEWLAVDAIERRDLEAAGRYAHGRRTGFIHGRLGVGVRRTSLDEVLGAPSRNTWDALQGGPNVRVASSPLLRAIDDALTGQPRKSWDLRPRRAAPAVMGALRRARSDERSLASPHVDSAPRRWGAALVEAHRLGMPLDASSRVSIDAVLAATAAACGASDEDVAWCQARLDDVGGPSGLVDEPDELTADAGRLARRLGVIAESLRRRRGSAPGPWADELDTLLTIDEALRTLEAADADEVHDAWRDLRWPVLIHGFDLMGARGLAGVGTTYIRWVGAQAYERGDAEILAHLHRYYVQLGM